MRKFLGDVPRVKTAAQLTPQHQIPTGKKEVREMNEQAWWRPESIFLSKGKQQIPQANCYQL